MKKEEIKQELEFIMKSLFKHYENSSVHLYSRAWIRDRLKNLIKKL